MESGEGFIRIFDLTNALVIATSAGFSNTTPGVIDLGTISNLPAASAVFELQMRHNAADSGKIRVSSVRFS